MEQIVFYAEYALFEEGEKDEALSYLHSWKKFTIRKLKKKYDQLQIIDEQIIEREPKFIDFFGNISSLALKLTISIEINGKIDK